MRNLLEVNNLGIEFQLHEQGVVRAVDSVSFSVPPGKTVALVGESGSGKSVISQAIMGILPQSAKITRGEIKFSDLSDGASSESADSDSNTIDIAKLDPNAQAFRAIRGGRILMIFQDIISTN